MSGERRPRGTGSLTVRRDRTGRETWCARAHIGGGRYAKTTLGPKRVAGTRDGLTRSQAEAALRRYLDDVASRPRTARRVTVSAAGECLVDRLRADGRKPSHIESTASVLRVHLVPAFGSRPLDSITRHDVERFAARQREAGLAPKTIRNHLGALHSVFAIAIDREWLTINPVRLARKPKASPSDGLRFLDLAELEALLRAVPASDVLGPVERALYLAAAMTGARQGELLALRWRDVDWAARKVRVHRSFVRGEYGSPKSRRGFRAIPLADRLAGELELLYQRSLWKGDDDLVFAHPHTGRPMDRSKLLKRFKAALARAEVRPVRFHDLRHTFATTMAASGVPLRTLQAWLGHEDAKTTEIYAHYAPTAHEPEMVDAAFRAALAPDRPLIDPWPRQAGGSDVLPVAESPAGAGLS